MVSAARSQKPSAATLALLPRLTGRPMLLGAEHHVHGPVHLREEFLEGEVEGPAGEPLRPGEARSRHLEVARRPGCELALEVGARHDPIHEPDAVGFLRPDGLAAQDQVAGPAGADQARQPVGAHAGEKGLLRRREPEDGVVGGNADVAGDNDLQAAAEAVPLDAGDDRLVQGLERAIGELGLMEPRVRDLARGEVREVQPRREGPALPGHQDDADGGVVLHLAGGAEHVVGPLAPHGVQHLGPVQPDLADRSALAELDPGHAPTHGRARRSRTVPSRTTCVIFPRSPMRAVGSPATSTRSARLPTAISPKSALSPARKRAFSQVAARNASPGVRPASTSFASSRWSPAPGKSPALQASLPASTGTPAARSLATFRRRASWAAAAACWKAAVAASGVGGGASRAAMTAGCGTSGRSWRSAATARRASSGEATSRVARARTYPRRYQGSQARRTSAG